MEINYYLNNISDNEAALILNSNYNKKILIPSGNIKEYLLSVSNINKVNQVLKMLSINPNVLSKTEDELTELEKTLIKIGWQLLQYKYLVLYYSDTLLNKKEKTFLKKLINKLCHEYHIKVLIFTNDIKFCFNLVDKIIIVNNREISKIIPADYYNEEIFKYIDIPDIVTFVKSSQKIGKKLDNYIDISELLKGIYRLW